MKLFELRAVTAAVESSGQTKAEAKVFFSITINLLFFLSYCSEILAVFI